MNKVLTCSAGFVACVAAMAVTCGPASAEPAAQAAPESVKTLKWGPDLKEGAGEALFWADGDTVQIIDRYADGRGVEVYIGGKELYLRNGSSQNFDLDLPEGKTVDFNICLIDGDFPEDGTCNYSKVRT